MKMRKKEEIQMSKNQKITIWIVAIVVVVATFIILQRDWMFYGQPFSRDALDSWAALIGTFAMLMFIVNARETEKKARAVKNAGAIVIAVASIIIRFIAVEYEWMFSGQAFSGKAFVSWVIPSGALALGFIVGLIVRVFVKKKEQK
jgi:hypothetical protein